MKRQARITAAKGTSVYAAVVAVSMHDVSPNTILVALQQKGRLRNLEKHIVTHLCYSYTDCDAAFRI